MIGHRLASQLLIQEAYSKSKKKQNRSADRS